MNQKYNTHNMPHTDILRVCLSCWKRLPTQFSRQIQGRQSFNSSPLICSGVCGSRWKRTVSPVQRNYSTTSNNEEYDVTNNPFYKKYEEKLKHLKHENPEEYEQKMMRLKEKMEATTPNEEPTPNPVVQKPKPEGFKGPRSWPPKDLDEIMKVDLVKDLSPDAIKQLWQEHHLSKDCLFSVLKPDDYEEMMAKSKLNPSFLFPLPKGDGYEFYLCQFGGKDVYFTPLGMFQLLKENAPPCLSIAHFAELKEEKGLVLMAGEYDDKVIKKNEALNLAKQMTLFYGKEAGDRYKMLRQFNSNPTEFQYMDIIEQYKENKTFLEEVPF